MRHEVIRTVGAWFVVKWCNAAQLRSGSRAGTTRREVPK